MAKPGDKVIGQAEMDAILKGEDTKEAKPKPKQQEQMPMPVGLTGKLKVVNN